MRRQARPGSAPSRTSESSQHRDAAHPSFAGRRRRLLEPEELAQRIADLLSERQAEDIVLMDIGKVSSFTDYFVVATAGNPRQMNALIESLRTDLRSDEARPTRTEGAADSGWVLLDFGDVIVHLFSPTMRSYYNLEGLWSKGVSVVHLQ